jgi:hypothetical protein
MKSIGRGLCSAVCPITALVLLLALVDGRRAAADNPKPDLSKECKYALLVGFGRGQNEESTAKASQDAVKERLISQWGFPEPKSFMHTKLNGNATKADIEGDLKDIEAGLERRNPDKVDKCIVKIHFQGHATTGKPDKNAPDNKDDHVGYDTADGGHFWDFELVKHVEKINEILKKKKFKQTAILIQIDTCYAQGLVGKLAEVTPANMTIAWSTDKSSRCSVQLQPGQPTPFTQGFINAFEEGKPPPTAEEAHKKATEARGLKDFNPGTKDGQPDKPTIIK